MARVVFKGLCKGSKILRVDILRFWEWDVDS